MTTPVERSKDSWILTAQAADADDLAEQIVEWNVDLIQLRPGSFNGNVTLVNLRGILLLRGAFNQPLLMQALPPPQCITIGCPTPGSDPLLFQGNDLQTGECIMIGTAASVAAVSRGAFMPTTLSMRTDVWNGAWLDDSKLHSLRGTQLQKPGTEWMSNYLAAIDWILDSIEKYPAAVQRAEVRDSLADSLLARINGFVGTLSRVLQKRDARAYRRLAVGRAREYICANITEPIRLAELCKQSGLQARTLEYGFQEIMGMSPLAYVKLLRLHNARKQLRSTIVLMRSVSEIALDCGFWHLSQFASDYKYVFGENPSVTRIHTLTLLSSEARRRQSVRAMLDCVPQLRAFETV